MFYLSPYADVAERQLSALIYYLTAFGLVDGDFDHTEKSFVREYVRKLLEQQAAEQMLFVPDEERRRVVDEKLAVHYQTIDDIEQDILGRWTESISAGESQQDFVREYLELRCYEALQSFDPAERQAMLAVVDEQFLSGGEAHPAEQELRDRLAALFEEGVKLEPSVVIDMPPPVTVLPQVRLRSDLPISPFFTDIEHPYSTDPGMLARQLAGDSRRVGAAMELLRRKRAHGAGRLRGRTSVFDFQGGEEFLDGHVHVMPPARDRDYALTVVGDLHGCYNCLKAVLVQSQFLQRIEAFEGSPAAHPEPRLVLLGDYVDRGRYSFDGVMRCILKLLLAYPRYVYVLRGNHEWYRLNEGTVVPAVWPAEGYAALRAANAWREAEEYRQLFEALPHYLFFGQLLFVHGGAPPDTNLKARAPDMASLNDPELRMLALWGDPSSADVIPATLQHKKTMRFSYGKLQLQNFLESLGCHTLIRGHEAVRTGFQPVYDTGNIRAYTVFSAGGAKNGDIAPRKSYRKVTPMALTVRVRGGHSSLEPWLIDYPRFTTPQTNGFYRPVV